MYRDLWNNSHEDIFIEATTRYIKYPLITGAPENMIGYEINPKIIHIDREPIGRLSSHLRYM